MNIGEMKSNYSHDTLLSETDLDARVRDILAVNGILYYGQLFIHDLDYYKGLKKFGAKSLTELKRFLKRSLNTNDEEAPGNWVFTFGDYMREEEKRILKYAREMDKAIERYVNAKVEYKPDIDLYHDLLDLEKSVESKKENQYECN